MIYLRNRKNCMILIFFIFFLINSTINCSANNENLELSNNNSRIVLLELFVQATCSTCPHAEFCLEDLSWEYGPEKVILLEEHLWGDGYDTEETNARYNWYIEQGGKGTPDLFINGLTRRIQGLACEDIDKNFVNYKKNIDSELAKCSYIKLSALKTVSNSNIIIEGKLKNISSLSLKDLAVCGMVYQEGDEPGISYWVRDIFPFQDLPLLLPQDTFDYKFISEPLIQEENKDKFHAVIFVQNLLTKEVLQAVYVE